jgi:hypothetical protein
MPILFLNYRNGDYTVASGKLVETYVDSWGEVWHEIAVSGGFVNLTNAFIVRLLPAVA